MNKTLALLGSAALVLGLAGPASAAPGGGHERHQLQTIELVGTTSVGGTSLPTAFSAVLSPCDGSFVGQGSASHTTTTVKGSYVDGVFTYVARYDHGATNVFEPDVLEAGRVVTRGLVVGADGFPTGHRMVLSGTVTVKPSGTTYKNHGQFKKAHGATDDPAFSCIGMKVKQKR